ncbi:MAG: hypothetical protein HYX34_05710 [Actinobacteria bacterium]|nr:hypothetical protein [Actinomycetota bacterium]
MPTGFALPPYPGRGVGLFTDTYGQPWWAYFVTGRSPASRARALVADERGLVVASTVEGAAHDSLRHYRCARSAGDRLVVGNGDHVDALADALLAGEDLATAVERVDPEPDPPLHTARLALVVGLAAHLVAVREEGGAVVRTVDELELRSGEGWIAHTYAGPLDEPITAARPVPVHGVGDVVETASELWEALDVRLRVGLALGRAPEPVPVVTLARS